MALSASSSSFSSRLDFRPDHLLQGGPVGEERVRRKNPSAGDPPHGTQTELPGWFRAEKDWDLLVVVAKCLFAAIEFKSQVGPSFGNNFNNRTEEALGNAADLWAAFREGAFQPSQRPWLRVLHAPGGSPRINQSCYRFRAAFPRVPGIQGSDLRQTLRDPAYQAGAGAAVRCGLLPTATREGGLRGEFMEPSSELSFANFMQPLLGKAMAIAATRRRPHRSRRRLSSTWRSPRQKRRRPRRRLSRRTRVNRLLDDMATFIGRGCSRGGQRSGEQTPGVCQASSAGTARRWPDNPDKPGSA